MRPERAEAVEVLKMMQLRVGWVLTAAVAGLVWGCSSPTGGSKSDATGAQTTGTATGGTATGGTADTTVGGTGDTGGTAGTDGTSGTGADTGTGSGTGTAPCDPPCQSPQKCVDGVCKVPVLCQAGTWICEGLTSKKQCNPEGTGFLEPEGCPGDQYCTSGQCGLKCSLDPKWGAYVGCVFWSVDLPVWDDPTIPNANTLPHALVISNPSELDATVQFTPPPGIPFSFTDLTIPGSGSKVFQFPSMDTSLSDIYDLAIRVESDRPVLVHQFNPWDNTYSNDASLLLPEPLFGQEHLVLSWPTDPRCLFEFPVPGLENFGGPCAHSFLSVVAPSDNTEVTVRVTARVMATPGDDPNPAVQAMPPGAIQSFVLNKGQVLNLDAQGKDLFETADLTGSLILSNKPVAVFSGHDSAAISAPDNSPPGSDPEDMQSCCLDHLEEQMIPVPLLGLHYVAAKSKDRGGEKDLWRIVAADDNVAITTSPPIEGLNGKTLAKKGQWIEAYTDESFEITAGGRILVGQYLVAQGNTNQGTGDPSMILAIPVERYRSTYPIMAPSSYSKNYVSIIRKPGAGIQVDGFPADAGSFQSIAGGQWELAWVLLSDGFHTITGDEPFGLSAYGYDSAASYGYPGGMTIPGEANP